MTVRQFPRSLKNWGSALLVETRPLDGIEINVKTSSRIHILEVESSYPIHKLKNMIKVRDGSPPEHQRIIFEGKTLEDHRTLADCLQHLALQRPYGLPNNSSLCDSAMCPKFYIGKIV